MSLMCKRWIMRLFSFVSLQRARSPEIDTDAQTDKTRVAEFSFSSANYAENS